MSSHFEKNARTVTLLTILSRATGLARDRALAVTFGAGTLMDAFVLAFQVPNLFRRLFGEGALSAAFLPMYAKLDCENPVVARQLATLVIALLLLFLGGLTLLGEAILYLISSRADQPNTAIWLMMIMLPYMPLVCSVAILGAMLQVHHRFGPTAAAPVVLNLFIVAAAIGAPAVVSNEIAHVSVVAWSVIAAGLVQVSWSLWSLRRVPWISADAPRSPEARGAMKRVLRQALPMFIGLGVLQLNTFLDGLIAGYPTLVGPTIFGYAFPLDSGALASLGFAQRLYEFPLGVFGIAVATAIFPALSRVAHDGDAFSDILRRGLRLVMFIGLPASVGLIMVRQPLTAAILQGGDFDINDTHRVSFVLLGYAPAIWAYSMTHVFTRAFYAKADSITPVKIAVAMVGLNLTLNLTLIWTPLKEAGLAWSTAICAVVQVAILARVIRRHADHVISREVLTSWGKTALVTLAIAASVWIVKQLLPGRELTWSWAIMQLIALVGTGAVTAFLAAAALRMPELRWAMGRQAD